MTVSTMKMTARQFLQLGEDPPGVRLELVDGEVAVSPSPTPKHSFIDRKLSYLLMDHLQVNDLGELYGDVDTIFGEHDIRRPDLIYFAKERLHLIGETSMEGPPDLCVEIISPSSISVDRKDKFKQYAAGRVANYWIVDPEPKTAEAFKLVRGKYKLVASGKENDLVRLPPFEDLEIKLGAIWPRR